MKHNYIIIIQSKRKLKFNYKVFQNMCFDKMRNNSLLYRNKKS